MGNKLLARATRGRAGKASSVCPLGPAFAKKFPITTAFMWEEVDADDRERDRSKVTVFIDGGDLRIAFSDPCNEQSLYLTIDDPLGMWEALEKALDASDLDWRAWKTSTPGKAKRK